MLRGGIGGDSPSEERRRDLLSSRGPMSYRLMGIAPSDGVAGPKGRERVRRRRTSRAFRVPHGPPLNNPKYREFLGPSRFSGQPCVSDGRRAANASIRIGDFVRGRLYAVLNTGVRTPLSTSIAGQPLPKIRSYDCTHTTQPLFSKSGSWAVGNRLAFLRSLRR